MNLGGQAVQLDQGINAGVDDAAAQQSDFLIPKAELVGVAAALIQAFQQCIALGEGLIVIRQVSGIMGDHLPKREI